MKPKVSVIIPVYNAEKYLKQCLDSVCNQTLKDIEIVCVNDCSTDDSLKVLKEYANNDSRIVIIDFKQNKGVSAARNAGIKKASGEFIGFVDSDDFISLDFFEKLYSFTEDGVDIVKGRVKSVENNVACYNCFIDKFDDNTKIRRNKGDFLFYFFTAIYRKEPIDRFNISFYEDLTYAEDLCFAAKAVAYLGQMICTDDVFYYYVVNNLSAMHSVRSRRDEYICSCRLAAIKIVTDINNSKRDEELYETQFQKVVSWTVVNAKMYEYDLELENKCINEVMKMYQGNSNIQQMYSNAVAEYDLYQQKIIGVLRERIKKRWVKGNQTLENIPSISEKNK